jgi:hypothetical protein
MERLFGISYPTVKNRLDRLAGKLKMVEVEPPAPEAPQNSEVLDMLARGEISAAEAIKRLS